MAATSSADNGDCSLLSLELLSMGVVPIVNENDTVSVSVSEKQMNPESSNLMCVIGNQIRRQRYPFCYYRLYDIRGLPFLVDRCGWVVYGESAERP